MPERQGSEPTGRDPSKESHPPLTTRWAPAARPRAGADAGTSLSNLKAIASPSAPAQGPEGQERDGVLACPRRACMTSPQSVRGACRKKKIFRRWDRRGQREGAELRARSTLWGVGKEHSSVLDCCRMNVAQVEKTRLKSCGLQRRLPALSSGSRRCLSCVTKV